ncbi:flavodoxin domain-containing protein [Limimaricola litoreus]|uniref:Protoporphyrinogen oxidase n=1 Tax=Limimaricola litoreus TaxID=2955316 RepID=A0A9X2FLZ4_9RHOB|nr:flavodoxin domain-containing protein [Limimaricola litoreus]MCP1167047.1 protoporphyrinogen oxidase [Limimaricola litoreus]
MKVIIIFASIEGQTGRIARFTETRLRAAGHDVALFDAADRTARINLGGADRIILAGSVHERRHPVAFEAFLAAHRLDLEARPTLLLSVSLSAAFPEGLEEAEDYVVEMTMRTRFTPTRHALVAGAIRTSKYDYFARAVVRHVVLRGRDHDPHEEEHEFTDWGRLEQTLIRFIADEESCHPAARSTRHRGHTPRRRGWRDAGSPGRRNRCG